jgi:F0F1-type ATP synthase membrane subunit c/vacuolar-type H+-ATPase subunit K
MIDLPLTAPDRLASLGASLGAGLAGFGAGFGAGFADACLGAFADLPFAAAGLETLDFAALGLADFAFGLGLFTFPSSNESSNR